MTSLLPEKVIQWITKLMSFEECRVEELRRHGSNALKVKEFKTISYEIEKLLSKFCLDNQTTKKELAGLKNRFCRPASNSKKDAWVRFLQNCFYKDRLLGIVVGRDDVIWKALDIQQTGKKRKKNECSCDEEEEGVTSTTSNGGRQLDKEKYEERCDYEEDEEEQERNELGLILCASERKRRKKYTVDTLVASTSFLNPSPLTSSSSRAFTSRLGGDSLLNTDLRSVVVENQMTSLGHHLRLHGTGALTDDLIIANAAQQQHLSAIAYQTIPHLLSQTPNCGIVVRAPSTVVQHSNSGELPSLAHHHHHHRQRVLTQSKLEAVRMMNPHYSTGTAQTSVSLYPSSSSLGPNYCNPLPVEQTPGCLLPGIERNLEIRHDLVRGRKSQTQLTSQHPSLPQVYPSTLAALATFKDKIKKEKVDTEAKIASIFSSTLPRTRLKTVSENNYEDEDENKLIPKSACERQVVGQLCFMGFNDVREVMRALRAVRINAKEESMSLSGLVEEMIVYIETKRENHNKSRKISEANEHSRVTNTISQAQNRSTSDIASDTLNNATIEEIIGFQQDDGKSGNSSIYALSSGASPIGKKPFRR